MEEKKYFKMFTNCLTFIGKNRSLVIDIQREEFTAIPNSMVEIIELFKQKKTVNELKKIYGDESSDTIDEYIDFLVKNEFGIIVDHIEFDLFLDMDTSFEIPFHITNCIVEISEINLLNFNKIINGLEKLICKNIQIICYNYINLNDIKNILNIVSNNDFYSIELILKYSDDFINIIDEIEKCNFKTTTLKLHSSFTNNIKIPKTKLDIEFIELEISSFRNCGIVDYKYFDINNRKVLESLNHNSCLHKKISIDKDGYIRNCPSMPQHFGNIKDITLEEALNHPDFKKYWNINKEQIEVCKDCEFRHICTDCRAYIEDPQNQYSKPLKCGYNPYTNEWAEWSTNPLKQKAIEYYGMQDLVKKDA